MTTKHGTVAAGKKFVAPRDSHTTVTTEKSSTSDSFISISDVDDHHPSGGTTKAPGDFSPLPKKAVFVVPEEHKSLPLLNWTDENKLGIQESGWKPTNPTKISFLAEEDNRKIGIIVEPRAPSFGIITPSRCGTRCWTFIQQLAQKNISFEAHGFFFNKSVETGKIDLSHRVKPFNGVEQDIRVYKNCTYIGLGSEQCEDKTSPMYGKTESVFIVSTEYCDKVLPTGVDVLHKNSSEFINIIESINNWIESSAVPYLGNMLWVNSTFHPRINIPLALQAYPVAPVVTPPVVAPPPAAPSGTSSPSRRGSSSNLTPRGLGAIIHGGNRSSRRGSGNSTNAAAAPPSSSSLRRVLPRPVGSSLGRNYAVVADTPGATMDEEDMDFDEYNDYHMPSPSRDRELLDSSIPTPHPSSSSSSSSPSMYAEELGQVVGIYPLHSSIDPLCLQLQPPPLTLPPEWDCGLLDHVMMGAPSYERPVTEEGYSLIKQVPLAVFLDPVVMVQGRPPRIFTVPASG